AIKMDGSNERVLYTDRGDALWDHPMSVPMLAPKGGKIAALTQPPIDFSPEIVSGPIILWDLYTGLKKNTGIIARNAGLSWFPDGQRLAYVAPGDTERIFILNVQSGETAPFHSGTNPLVSTDGKSMLITAGDERALVNLESGAVKEVSWPGNYRGPIA